MSNCHARNTPQCYGWVAILLHWLMAVVIFGLFGLGVYMVDLTYYDPWYKDTLNLHKSVGLVLALCTIFRLSWRWHNTVPTPLSTKRWENLVAHGTHYALYFSLILLFISGYLISTADGRPISVFGWFQVPALLTLSRQEDWAGTIHACMAWTLMAIVLLHAAAALKHHWIEKDQTLIRMLKAPRDSASPSENP